MSNKDAKVKVGADASEIERAMGAAMRSVNNAGKQFKQEFNEAARSIANDLASIALAGAKVNFSAQHQQVLEFEKLTAKMSVSTRKGLASVREEAMKTGLALGRQPNEVLKWTNSVQQLTYSFKGTNQTMSAMSNLALKAGREVESFSGLAVQFGKMGVEGESVNDALATMEAQAKAVGIPVAALVDGFTAAGSSVEQFAAKGVAGVTQVTGLIASAKATGLDMFAAQRVGGKMAGMLQGDTLKYERILGRNITDSQGHVKDVGKTLYDVTAAGAKYYGGSNTRAFERFMIRSSGGDAELGMARVNMLRQAEKTGVKTFDMAAVAKSQDDAQKRYLATDAGKRDQAGVKLFESSNKLMNSSTALGRAADALKDFAAHNPIASTAIGSVGGGLINSIAGKGSGAAGWAVKLGREALGKATTGTALGSAAGVSAASAGAVLGAGALGYGIGTLLDKKFGWSDTISNALHGGSIKEQEDAKDRELAKRGEAGYQTPEMITKAIEKAKIQVNLVMPGKNPEQVSSAVNQSGGQ
jgi:hypothetical protein